MTSTLRIGFNTLGASCERLLDLPGYVPGLSLYTAPLRQVLACSQLIAGLAMGLFAIIAQFYYRHYQLDLPEGLYELQNGCSENLLNAGANFLRAYIEALPFINMGLLIFDQGKALASDILQNSLPKVIDWRAHIPLLFRHHTSQEPFVNSRPNQLKPSAT